MLMTPGARETTMFLRTLIGSTENCYFDRDGFFDSLKVLFKHMSIYSCLLNSY